MIVVTGVVSISLKGQSPNFSLLCVTSVFSVTLWWAIVDKDLPQSHREHRGRTETSLKPEHYRIIAHPGFP
jgi:hypothetical protein